MIGCVGRGHRLQPLLRTQSTPKETPVRNPWLGFELGPDPVRNARLLQLAHRRVIADGRPSPIVRSVITSSWERSQEAGVDAADFLAPGAARRELLPGSRAPGPLAARY